jgi:poly-gamma-glutamate capsule biosynthesis protein CapA/YwtB (metallophosphatase superfamily)
MKLGVVGDLILSDHLKIDASLRAILRSTDLNIANLEAPFIREGMKPALKAGLFQLTSDCKLLHDLNIRAVSLANNHMCDFGPEGIEITRQVLEDQGIAFFGAGSTLEQALEPAEIILHNRKLALWGFMQRYASGRHFATSASGGVAELRKDLIQSALKKSDADIKILYNHWNQEFENYPEPVNKLLAEELTAHCDLVIGSHSHCLQGIQSAGKSNIFYGMGNFSMPALDYAGTRLIQYPEISRKSMIVVLNLDEADPGYTLHPIYVDESGCLVSDAEKEDAEKIHVHLKNISEALQKPYSSYRKFYKSNKQRKLLPTQVRNRHLNRLRLGTYYRVDQMLRYSERKLAALLNRVGLLSFVKRRMSSLLQYLHSNR